MYRYTRIAPPLLTAIETNPPEILQIPDQLTSFRGYLFICLFRLLFT